MYSGVKKVTLSYLHIRPSILDNLRKELQEVKNKGASQYDIAIRWLELLDRKFDRAFDLVYSLGKPSKRTVAERIPSSGRYDDTETQEWVVSE